MVTEHVSVSDRVLEMERELRGENFDRPQYRYALKMLRVLRPSQKRVAEFGSGRGEFSRLLRELGYDVTCVDINSDNIKWLEESGFNGFVADLNEPLAQVGDGKYDGAFMLEVIEHIPKAELFLRETYRILKPNGYLVLSTPNPYSIWHRLPMMFGRPIRAEGYHYRFFTYRSLLQALRHAGFECKIEMHSSAGFGINFLLSVFAKKTITLKLPGFLRGLLTRKFYFVFQKM